jgi:hypothetical protein
MTPEQLILARGRIEVDAGNVDRLIGCFLGAVETWPSPLPAWDDPLRALLDMKRGNAGFSLYRSISLFEVGNRLCSDLTLLFGVRRLLHERALTGSPIPFIRYSVALGTAGGFDIEAEADGQLLIGEAFHVSSGYHPTKTNASLDKLLARKANKYASTNQKARCASHRVIVEGREVSGGPADGRVLDGGVVVLVVPLLETVDTFRTQMGEP